MSNIKMYSLFKYKQINKFHQEAVEVFGILSDNS